MCQVYGPSIQIGCNKCGAVYYEYEKHKCKVFVPFAVWNARLQEDASKPYLGSSSLLATCHEATQDVAAWPEWKRRLVWSEEFRFSVRESNI
jgi:hypothetical protein